MDHPQAKQLNKTDTTADIKEFFTPMPHVPGQEKMHMLCKLCIKVILQFILSFSSCGFPQARDWVPQAGEGSDL